MARRFGRKSPADHKRAVNAALRMLAAASDNPRAPELLKMQTPVRDYKPRQPSGERLEKHILADILAALQKHMFVAWVRRRQSGLFRDGDRWIRVGRKGDPDIDGMLHGGQMFAIEVKREGEKPDELQQRRINEIKAAGGLSGCAHSVAEAIAIIEG